MNILQLKPADISVEEGLNTRYNKGDMKALKASIVDRGIQDPIIVRKRGGAYIIGSQGHRRFEAVRQLIEEGVKIDAIPARLEEPTLSLEQRTLDIVSLNSGKELEMLEEAEVYHRLVEMSITAAGADAKKANAARIETIKDIAAKVGKSETHIRNCLRLLTAPAGALRLVKSGKVAATFVLELMSKYADDPDAVVEALMQAVADADSKGKGKASKKNAAKAKSEKEEGDEEEADQDKEDAKAHRAATKRTERLNESLEKFAEKSKLYATVVDAIQAALSFADGTTITLNDVQTEIKTTVEKITKEAIKGVK